MYTHNAGAGAGIRDGGGRCNDCSNCGGWRRRRCSRVYVTVSFGTSSLILATQVPRLYILTHAQTRTQAHCALHTHTQTHTHTHTYVPLVLATKAPPLSNKDNIMQMGNAVSHVSVSLSLHWSLCLSLSLCMRECMCVCCACVSVCACASACACVCVCVCVCVCTAWSQRWREVERGGERWRDVGRWREVERGGERWRGVDRRAPLVSCARGDHLYVSISVYLCVSTGTQMHTHRMAHCDTLVLWGGAAS